MDAQATTTDVGGCMQEEIDRIIERYRDEQDSLLEILRSAQQINGYLTPEMMMAVAERLKVPVSQVYGVATFYSMLNTTKKGENVIRVCQSAPCHVLGSDTLIKAVKDELGIDVGETTADGTFTLESTSCLGICSVGPAMMINDRVYGNLTRERVRMILREYRRKEASGL